MNPECHSDGKQMSRLGNRSHILFPSQRHTKRCQKLWKEKRKQCLSFEGKLKMHSSLSYDFCGLEGLLSKDVLWMDGNGAFFFPSPQRKTYHKGKTNPVLILILESKRMPLRDIFAGLLFVVFFIELERFFFYSQQCKIQGVVPIATFHRKK